MSGGVLSEKPARPVASRRDGQHQARPCVVRNRVRRRLREIYRLNREKMPAGYDIIIVARVRAAEAPYRKLERHYLRCLGELGLLTDA